MAALAAIILADVAAGHPGLRFVDFIPFSVRARTLFSPAAQWVDPRYPLGYPAALRLGHALTGDVLLAGKALSVAGGVLAVGAVARWISPWAGLWLLAQPALMRWGTTEGTDTLAAALCIAALAAARRSPRAAGVLLGLGCLTRYTAVTAAPVVFWLSAARGGTLAAFLLATAPHWAVALLVGAPLLPDQSENVAIGGHTGPLLSPRLLAELPRRLWMSALAAVHDVGTIVGGVGLAVGMILRDRRAWALAGAALLHLAAVSLAFSNDRLVLPATLMIAAGAAWSLPRWWLLLPAAAASAGLAALPLARDVSPTVASLSKVIAEVEDLEGPFLTTSPWFYQREEGWVTSGVLVRRIPGDPRRLTPQAARAWALERQVPHFAVDIGRVRRSYPGLAPLLQQAPEGYRPVGRSPGWLIFAFEPAP